MAPHAPGRRAPFVLAATILALHGCSPPPPEAIATLVFPIATLHNGGDPAKVHNIVIVGDGFKVAQLDTYRAAADAFVAELMSAAPFGALQDAFNVYRVDVISKDSGVDVPTDCGTYHYADPSLGNPALDVLKPWARTPREKDTALAVTWCDAANTQNHTFLDSEDENQVWEAALSSGVFPHNVIVLVNDWMYGAASWPDAPRPVELGASGGIAYASIGQNLDGEVNPLTGLVLQPNATKPWYPKVAIHELGHLGPFLLLDEYGNSEESIDSATQAEIDASPNLTSTLSPLKWDALKTPDVHLPTDCRLEPTPEVGAAPGGEGYATGVFHARCACRMNKFLHDSFCPVCRQQIVLSLGGATFNTPWKMRMLADSVVMEIASDGYYFIRIKVPGVKPPLPPLRGDPKPLRAFGRTFEADGILLELPASSEVPNRIEYELMRATSATAADASVVERGMLPIRSTRPGARIEQFDMKTHRVTVGVIIR